jgi:hypothetical protein
MSEKHGSSRNQAVAVLEVPGRRAEQRPPAVPAFAWGLQDRLSRPPLPHMPNGDPPTLVLWGAEDV